MKELYFDKHNVSALCSAIVINAIRSWKKLCKKKLRIFDSETLLNTMITFSEKILFAALKDFFGAITERIFASLATYIQTKL